MYRIGSWTYSDTEVPLKLEIPEGLSVDFLDKSSRYSITDPTAKIVPFVCQGENYPTVVIEFTAKPSSWTPADSSQTDV